MATVSSGPDDPASVVTPDGLVTLDEGSFLSVLAADGSAMVTVGAERNASLIDLTNPSAAPIALDAGPSGRGVFVR